ncbi:MAG: hypothetical protein ACRDTP_11255, partial [Mycobacteriales bacterium]
MTDHDIYRELVVGRVLDALEPGDDALLTTHLASCDACRELLTEMRHTAAALAYDVEQVDPPAELLGRIRAALPEPAAVDLDPLPAVPAPSRHLFGTRTLRGGRTRTAVRTATRVAAGVAAAAVLFGGGYAWHAHRDDRAGTLASDQLVLDHLKS